MVICDVAWWWQWMWVFNGRGLWDFDLCEVGGGAMVGLG